MKTYSVKQISELLDTNPETVRRWIRDGKLNAIQSSRKNGNVVDEAELKRFMSSIPKYASIPIGVASMAAAPMLAPVAIPSLLVNGIVAAVTTKNASKSKKENISEQILSAIQNLEKSMQRKEEMIRQLQEDLEIERGQLAQLKELAEKESL